MEKIAVKLMYASEDRSSTQRYDAYFSRLSSTSVPDCKQQSRLRREILAAYMLYVHEVLKTRCTPQRTALKERSTIGKEVGTATIRVFQSTHLSQNTSVLHPSACISIFVAFPIRCMCSVSELTKQCFGVESDHKHTRSCGQVAIYSLRKPRSW